MVEFRKLFSNFMKPNIFVIFRRGGGGPHPLPSPLDLRMGFDQTFIDAVLRERKSLLDFSV